MARVNLNSTMENDKTTELLKLIPLFGQNKATLDEYDKLVKSENAQIKSLMSELNLDTLTVEGWKVSYSASKRTSMNEDKLLDLFKQYPELASVVVKTKEYVDMDALESAIYNGNIGEDILIKMKSCEDSKTVETLRISKAKKEEK